MPNPALPSAPPANAHMCTASHGARVFCCPCSHPALSHLNITVGGAVNKAEVTSFFSTVRRHLPKLRGLTITVLQVGYYPGGSGKGGGGESCSRTRFT